MDVESLSVGYIISYIGQSDCIQPFINTHDREPFYDGFLILYNNKSQLKKEYMGQIKVQVKGQEVSSVDAKKTIKHYSVDIEDLNAYKKDGGCIYIVVECDKNGGKAGYFNILTPLKIKELLSSRNMHTKNIELEKLPLNINTFNNLIKSGFNDCKIQHRQRELNEITFNEINKYIKQGYQIVANIEYSMMKDTDYIYNYQHTFYLKNGVDIRKLPGVNNILSVSNSIKITIGIGSIIYYNDVYRTETKDFIAWNFGKAFTLKFERDSIEKKADFSVTFKVKDYALADYIKDTEFMINLIKHKRIEICINEKIETLFFDADCVKQFDVEALNSYNKFAKDIRTILNVLDINSDEELLVDKIDKKSSVLLNLLDSVLLKNRVLKKGQLKDYNPFLTMEIGNLCLLMYVENLKNIEGYKVYKVSEKRFKCHFESKDNKHVREISHYFILSPEDYAKISNLNFDDIFNSYIECGNIGDINECIVKLISAYDISKKSKLIDLAKCLINWSLQIVDDNTLYNYLKLNLLQILYRENHRLTSEEIDYLNSIVYNSEYSNYMKIGACIILNYSTKVKELINKLTDEEKKGLFEMPIYTLYRKNIDSNN